MPGVRSAANELAYTYNQEKTHRISAAEQLIREASELGAIERLASHPVRAALASAIIIRNISRSSVIIIISSSSIVVVLHLAVRVVDRKKCWERHEGKMRDRERTGRENETSKRDEGEEEKKKE